MAVLIDRMLRAAKLEPALYEEVEHDESATGQAIGVVVISSLAAGIGSAGVGGPLGLVGGLLIALFGWALWVGLTYFIGTRLLPEPATRADLGQVLRTTGFAAAPGVLRVLVFLPVLGGLINLIAGLWMLAAFVVAVRAALDYESTGKAILVCAIGFLIQLIVMSLLMMVLLGGAFMAGGR